MTAHELLTELDRHADALRARGAKGLWLFGSTARDEARADSDVDLFVDPDETRTFSLVDLVDMKLFLEDSLGRRVDLITRDSLNPRLRSRIEAAAMRVF